MRSELNFIGAAFDKMPSLTGTNRAVVVNSGGTALTTTTGTLALAGNFALTGAYSCTLVGSASVVLNLPILDGTLITAESVKTLTNTTFNTAGTGNAFQIAGTAITSITGSGAVALANSPALTGTPTAPTAAQGVNTAQIATTAYVVATITALINNSPATLNTLKELADALGDDPNFATTITNLLALKAPLVSPHFTTPVLGIATATTINGLTVSATTGTLTVTSGKTLNVTDNTAVSGTHSGTSSGSNTGDQTWAGLGGGTMGQRNVTISTSDASGTPSTGAFWFKVAS